MQGSPLGFIERQMIEIRFRAKPIVEAYAGIQKENAGLEPHNHRANKAETEACTSVCPAWYREPDSNRRPRAYESHALTN